MASAGDWVKMRIWLEEDPKVIAMAALLIAMKPFLDWLGCAAECVRTPAMRDMVESKVATSLRRVWGVTRRDGLRDNDDYVLEYSTLDTLDRIAGLPGFGAAMESVGWAVVEEDNVIRFPKLLPHVTSPDEIAREKAKERKRQQRERKKNAIPERDGERDLSRDEGVTCPVTCPTEVTHRVEENRREIEEENTDPPTPRGGEEVSLPPENRPVPQKLKLVAAEPIAFPEPLQGSPEFAEVWERWETHRRETRHALKPTTRASQLKLLASWGVVKAVAAIEQSICNGWQGLFESKADGGGRSAGQRPDADEQRRKREAKIDAMYADLVVPGKGGG